METMIGAILALAVVLVVGVPIAMALPGAPARLSLLIGEGYLLGSGAIALLLTALSLVSIPWSVQTLMVGAAGLATSGMILVFRRGLPEFAKPSIGWPNAIDLATLVLVAGFLRFATAAPSIEFDYILIWGLKGKEFWLAHGIDWSFLQQPQMASAHMDYPILVPQMFVVQALLTGSWPEHWMGVITAAFGVSALLVVRGLLATEIGALASALVTFAHMPLVFSNYMGLGEGPLIAYSIAGLLWMRSALRQGSSEHALRAAVYLGFAASCKNEGMTLIVAAAIALVAARRPRVLTRMWPAFVIAGPWWILRALHHLSNDLAVPGVFDRLSHSLLHPVPILLALANKPVGHPLFWLGATMACLFAWRRIAGEERFLTVTILMQLLFFVSVYFVTPHDVVWHVGTSWDRIVRQLMPAAALLAVFSTLPIVKQWFPGSLR